jgi:hypothetical protein
MGACFLYVVVGEREWDGIGPATPWKYPRVMLVGPKVAGFSTDSRFHVAMLNLRYHAVGKHGGHISGTAFPNHARGVGGEPSAVFLLRGCFLPVDVVTLLRLTISILPPAYFLSHLPSCPPRLCILCNCFLLPYSHHDCYVIPAA